MKQYVLKALLGLFAFVFCSTAATREAGKETDEVRVLEAGALMSEMDTDHDGKVSETEALHGSEEETEKEIAFLKEQFSLHDKDRNGFLDLSELVFLIEAEKKSEAELSAAEGEPSLLENPEDHPEENAEENGEENEEENEDDNAEAKELMEEMDLDHDGKVSKDEAFKKVKGETDAAVAFYKEQFPLFDANGDGFLDLNELALLEDAHDKAKAKAADMKVAEEQGLLQTEEVAPEGAKVVLQQMDADNDGKVSKAELLAEAHPDSDTEKAFYETQFPLVDKDKDGFLDVNELGALMAAEKELEAEHPDLLAKSLMSQLDADHDGKVSKAEVVKGGDGKEDKVLEFLKTHFSEYDKNGDGFLDVNELTGFEVEHLDLNE